MKKVTFGIVSCNRLHYLKSCFESLVDTTKNYVDKEIIIVDNASVEQGMESYLQNLIERGVKVLKTTDRDPPNEFARGLNTITKEATGDYLCILQGDMQFVLPDWINDVVDFYEKNKDVVGSIVLDAQRRPTIANNNIKMFVDSRQPSSSNNRFFADMSRDPISPAADAFFERSILEKVLPWCETNLNHEGGMDSENEMRYRVRDMMSRNILPRYVAAMAAIPPAIAIYTDSRGTQGRVRGNKRFGDYWQAKDSTGWKYYDYITSSDYSLNYPNSIEVVAKPIGFEKYLDENGIWLKNPIRPETASEKDWTHL